jgi:hypothetical protein
MNSILISEKVSDNTEKFPISFQIINKRIFFIEIDKIKFLFQDINCAAHCLKKNFRGKPRHRKINVGMLIIRSLCNRAEKVYIGCSKGPEHICGLMD